MVKVLHVVGRMNMAGLETMIMNYYRFIDKEKVQFNFLVLSGKAGDYDKEIMELGGRIIYPSVKYDWKNPIPFIKWFNRLLSNEDFHILHSHNGGASVIFSIAKKHGLKIIVHSHNTGTKNEPMYKLKLRNLSKNLNYKYVDLFLACSKEAGEYQFGNRDFSVINNAIDVEKYQYNECVREKIRSELGIKHEFVIGTVGRLDTPKNPDGIIHIFNDFQCKHEDCKLLWIGTGVLKDEIENKLNDLNIRNKVIMPGSVNNVNEMLQAMDVFILPSIYEGLGIVAIEAQASGLNTICSNTVSKEAEVSSLCKFVPLKDYSKWYNAIANIYEERSYRSNTINDIRNNGYDICSEVQKLSDLYVNLASDDRR